MLMGVRGGGAGGRKDFLPHIDVYLKLHVVHVLINMYVGLVHILIKAGSAISVGWEDPIYFS